MELEDDILSWLLFLNPKIVSWLPSCPYYERAQKSSQRISDCMPVLESSR
jgi:hypothetical protein